VIVIGKVLQLGDRMVLATPYRNRRFHTPSIPQAVLEYLLGIGAEDWVVRLDQQRAAYRIRLSDIPRVATISPDGEWVVPFHHFTRCAYVEWPFVEQAVLVEP
jgi:hypothetical protein